MLGAGSLRIPDAAPRRPRHRRGVTNHSYVDESSELTLEGASGFTAAREMAGRGKENSDRC